jgi:hypothetical protein
VAKIASIGKIQLMSLTTGKLYLQLADNAVSKNDTETLLKLHKILENLILDGVAASDASLIEINEYIDEAISALEQQKTPEEIKQLSIRKLLE